MGKINSMSLVSFLDHQQKCRCTLLSISLEKKHFPANTEIGCENWRNTKVGCTSRPAERLVTCHCGCTLLSIDVRRSVLEKIKRKTQKHGRSFWRQEVEVGNKPTKYFFLLFNPLPSPPSVTFHIVTFNLQYRVKGLRHIGRIQMFDSSLNKPEQKCFYATRSSQPQPI